MAKVIVVYGSTTGNTEALAKAVVSGLEEGGLEVRMKNVSEAEANELTDYDVIVLGCSTWGEGELQDDFIDFYEKMKNLSLSGKKAAVFGPGDKESYPDTFCKAVDLLEEKLKESGAKIVAESFKVDGEVEEVIENAKNWGLKIAKSI